jgi:hypothetical protein
MADPETLKRIDEPQGEETKGSRERSRPPTGSHPATESHRPPVQPSVTARSKDSSNAPSGLRART